MTSTLYNSRPIRIHHDLTAPPYSVPWFARVARRSVEKREKIRQCSSNGELMSAVEGGSRPGRPPCLGAVDRGILPSRCFGVKQASTPPSIIHVLSSLSLYGRAARVSVHVLLCVRACVCVCVLKKCASVYDFFGGGVVGLVTMLSGWICREPYFSPWTLFARRIPEYERFSFGHLRYRNVRDYSQILYVWYRLLGTDPQRVGLTGTTNLRVLFHRKLSVATGFSFWSLVDLSKCLKPTTCSLSHGAI